MGNIVGQPTRPSNVVPLRPLRARAARKPSVPSAEGVADCVSCGSPLEAGTCDCQRLREFAAMHGLVDATPTPEQLADLSHERANAEPLSAPKKWDAAYQRCLAEVSGKPTTLTPEQLAGQQLEDAMDRANWARAARIQEHAEAINLAEKLAPAAPAPSIESEYTTAALLADYIASRKARKRKGVTLAYYECKAKPLRRLLPRLVRDLSHAVLLGYVNTRYTEGAGAAVKRELGFLSSSMRLGRKNLLVEIDPRDVIPEVDSLSEPRERVLSPQEVWGLCLYFATPRGQGDRTRIRAAQLAYCVAVGAEPAAMACARRSDPRDDCRGALVQGTKNKRRSGRLAATPLPLQRAMVRWARAEVAAYRARKTRSKKKLDGDLMFPPWSNARQDWIEACDALGIPHCAPTDFRRSYNTWLRRHGVRRELAEKCMGHAPSAINDRHYTVFDGEDLLRLVEADVAHFLRETPCACGACDGLRGVAPADTLTVPADTLTATEDTVARPGVEPGTRGFSSPDGAAAGEGKTEGEPPSSGVENALACALRAATAAGQWAAVTELARALAARRGAP